MNIVSFTNILWFGSKIIAEYEEKINSFTAKYSSPTMGYLLFAVILILGVIFIKAFANK